MSNYNEIKNKMKKIENLLNEMNMDYNSIDLKISANEKIPVIMIKGEFANKEYKVFFFYDSYEGFGEWITARCPVYEITGLNEKKRNRVFTICLQLSDLIPETTYSICNDLIYVEGDMPLDLSIDSFDFELQGLDLGVSNFIENMEKFGFKIPDQSKLI